MLEERVTALERKVQELIAKLIPLPSTPTPPVQNREPDNAETQDEC